LKQIFPKSMMMMKELRIFKEKGGRRMKITIRFPHEFHGLGNGWLKAIRLWLFYKWYRNDSDIYNTKGIRILGFEISDTNYGHWD